MTIESSVTVPVIVESVGQKATEYCATKCPPYQMVGMPDDMYYYCGYFGTKLAVGEEGTLRCEECLERVGFKKE